MDGFDLPIAFGQHQNAEIGSQITDSRELLGSINSLQPQIISQGGESPEAQVLRLIVELQSAIPEPMDLYELKVKLNRQTEQNPLDVVLVQELQRYNILLRKLSAQLAQLESGMKGLSVITQELESIQKSLEQNLVPAQWGDSYFSLKPLASWIADLKERYSFFTTWATKGTPHHFWIGAFTYPTGFTTSLLQKFSRKA